MILDVSIVIDQTFTEQLTSFKSNETIDLKNRLEKQISLQLSLVPPEYYMVIKLSPGSIVVDGLVILQFNSTENKTTIERNLVGEIQGNNTGYLQEFNATKVVKVEGINKI